VRQNCLEIECSLENTGTKPVHTDEYSHNFVCVDDWSIGPDYELRFSQSIPKESKPDEGIRTVSDSSVSWGRIPSDAFYWRPFGRKEPGLQWELLHKPSGVGMRESVDFPVQKIALWGREHVVSPEVFYEIQLAPGERTRWKRTFEFFT
jgi:hypothetical protein